MVRIDIEKLRKVIELGPGALIVSVKSRLVEAKTPVDGFLMNFFFCTLKVKPWLLVRLVCIGRKLQDTDI